MPETLGSIEELIATGQAYLRIRPYLATRLNEPEEILHESRIWISSVRSQDDIYEGNPRFVWQDAAPDIGRIRELARRRMANRSAQEIDAQVDEILRRMSDPPTLATMKENIERMLSQQYSNSSILSFFKDPTVQANWAHYGQAGNGYGLIYDFSIPWSMSAADGMAPIDAVPFPVNYVSVDRRPAIKLEFGPSEPEGAFEDLKTALLTKADHWREQAEERLFRVGIPAGYLSFPADSLRALVLGYNLADSERTRLIRLARERNIPLLVLEVAPDDATYRLILRECN